MPKDPGDEAPIDEARALHRSEALPHVVVIGAGFAGLATVQSLAKAPVRVTLVDAANHHLFQPLLYQVATAGLSGPQIAAPIRFVLRRQLNAKVLLGRVERIDVARRMVPLPGRELHYDWLVLATGSTHAYFGNDEWATFAPGLKTLDDALLIRRRVLLAFERAELLTDPAERAAQLTFVIIGGGPTGVELAGTMAEIARHTLRSEFRSSDTRSARILLVEAGDRVLQTYDEGLSAHAARQLRELGVEVRFGGMVTGIDADGVRIGDEAIASRTVIWAAGVAASPLARCLGAPLDRAGRVQVDATLQVPGHPEIFVAGDLAALADENGNPVPGVAPAAEQMGRHVAANLQRSLRGQLPVPFRYRDRGSMATIGRRRAIADLGWVRLWGAPAWWSWLLVHLVFLIGFRNRLFVLVDWAWSYFTFARGARLIVGTEGDERVAPPKGGDGKVEKPVRKESG
jgi:NADH:ubiquinone reductase (H+-translocating)